MSTSRMVGHFAVLEALGAGGMGEVFKARDTRLNRFVAIKFLPEAASAEARERFQREAQAIAALNHPHICTLHEIGEDGGRPYLVLELLEGETLRARLARGGLAPEQVLDWATQIADALDAAHKRGVLHRDLKPDNIWVSSGGHIKVLDFGLAQMEAPSRSAGGEQPTLLTSPGQTMGTVPYMSPEQARGQALDARSDIFSFGSVFYEMASGRPAFPAANAADSIAAVLGSQPAKLSAARPDLPPMITQVAERCLEKDPELRYQSAADLRGELKRLKRESGTNTSAAAAAVVATNPPTGRRWLWAAAALAIAGAGAAAWLWLRPAAPPPTALRLGFRQLTFSGQVEDAVISPDGKFLAHVDRSPLGTSLHLLSISSGSDVEIVPPGAGCCQSPSFSPDGGEVYFLENRVLRAVPVLGGTVRTVVAAACSGAGFSPDGSRIAYLATDGPTNLLMVARADGSQPQRLATAPAGNGFTGQCWGGLGSITHAPAWSSDARWIAVARAGPGSPDRIELVDSRGGDTQDLGADIGFAAADATWLAGGEGLVFTAAIPSSAASQLWEVSYPGGRMTQLTNDLQGYTSASLSAQGEIALVHSSPQSSIWAQAQTAGPFAELPGGGASQDGSAGLAWTPQDGLVSFRDLGGTFQLWSENGDGSGARATISSGLAIPTGPNVAPDGRIVFQSGLTATAWSVNADGSGLASLTPLAAGEQALFPVLAHGGREVAYLFMERSGAQALWTVPLAGGSPHQISTAFIYVDGNPASPDGAELMAVEQIGADFHQPVILRLGAGPATVTPIGLDFKTMQAPYGWTPDGRAITYVANQGTIDNLWAFPLDGRKPYAITHFTDLRIYAYAFSHDGRLAISRGSQNSDAVVATGLGASAGDGISGGH